MVEVSQDRALSFETPVRDLLNHQGFAHMPGCDLRVDDPLAE